MKKLKFVFAMILITALGEGLQAQDNKPEKEEREPKNLRGNLTGKWRLMNLETDREAGVWDFKTDGKFESTGHAMSVKDASFRTDEGRSVVYIQVGEEISEWKANITEDGIITLTEITPEKKTKPAKFRLTKVEEN